jgi:Protein of unknown function (DUF4199)
MKRIVLTFGLIAGVILSAMMLITLPFHDQLGFDRGLVVGYTTMLIAFLLVFFGVRSYRDNVGGGTIGFWRAFVVGILIAGVASACYAATWEVYYFTVKPDILAKYQLHELEKARTNGASAEAIAKQKAEMDSFAKMYENPAVNAALAFTEPLPVALIVALVSAGVLSRRRGRRHPLPGFTPEAEPGH